MSTASNYSWSDRLLHRLAFRSPGLQVALADVESVLFKSRLEDIKIDRPAFISALPRAGTTLVLNLLVQSGHFASHTYEDMPFVFCPMMWQTFASRFHTYGASTERAHKDGLTIALDSPEAFEEMLWKYFWPRHYGHACIEPWENCESLEFLEFLASHMTKIIALRTRNAGAPLRYLSKNNMNIARLRCLPRAVADARIVVLFRDPFQHAESLRLQHLAFLDVHRRDDFSRQYMAGLGHHDFGINLRPVNFGGWLAGDRRPDALGLGFWLEYWNATYRYVRTCIGDNVRLLSYRQLTEKPEAGLGWLAAFLEVTDPATLVRQSTKLRAPRVHEIGTGGISPEVVMEARELYAEMEKLATF